MKKKDIILSFLFTAVLFNSAPIDLFESMNLSGRNLASDKNEELSCLKLIAQFYPGQSIEFLNNRINLNLDFHSFYRSFVPLYYQVMKEEKSLSKVGVLKKYISTIGGDVHSENFGFIIDDKGNVIFSINDFDDSTQGPVYLDVFRHFISISIVNKDISWSDYLAAYESGLRENAPHFSSYTEKKMESAIDDTKAIMAESIKRDPPKFIKKMTPNRDLSEQEAATLKKGLQEKFPEIQIADQYMRIKQDGGSAGMKRMYVLAELKSTEQLLWLDIKETGVTSFDKVFSANQSASYQTRIGNLKKNGFNGKIDLSASTILIAGDYYSMRSLDHFALKTKLEDIKEKHLKDFLLDEAQALGQFHANSIRASGQSVEDYAHDWNTLDHSDLKEISENVKDQLQKIYSKSK